MAQRRSTHQRRLVLEAVRGRRDHPTADDIFLEVRGRDERISRATVYRNLHLLADDGEITSVRAGCCERFDARREAHAHLLCTGCGAVSDAPLPYHAELDREVAGLAGYAGVAHATLFEGLCPSCQGDREGGR